MKTKIVFLFLLLWSCSSYAQGFVIEDPNGDIYHDYFWSGFRGGLLLAMSAFSVRVIRTWRAGATGGRPEI